MPKAPERRGPAKDLSAIGFREKLNAGRVVAIVSDEAMVDLALGGYNELLKSYRAYVEHPSPLPESLVNLAKFRKYRANEAIEDLALKVDYLEHVKDRVYQHALAQGVSALTEEDERALREETRHVTAYAQRLGYRGGDDPNDPLQILANRRFKIFLTTSPYTFLEEALRGVKGVEPVTEVCRWKKELQNSIPTNIEPSYQPSPERPLVYHLLGLDEHADSLVLTEDDYLEYLGNICENRGNESTDYVPALVRKAFSDDLLLLGFHLDSWAFRVLFAGFIKRSEKSGERGVCCIQVGAGELGPEAQALAQDYLKREARLRVVWRSLEDYVRSELK